MEFIRLLNPRHFDPTRGKFTSLAFKNSTGGGASVILVACVEESGVPICDHIAAYYPERITGRPTIFWRFDEAELPEAWRAEQQTSDTGDVCHHNIHGVTDRQLRALLGSKAMADLSTCAPDGLRATRLDDVAPTATPLPPA